VVGLRYEDLAPDVIFQAKRCMLDTLGVQIRGATLPWIEPVYRYVRTLAGQGDATVTYHGDRLPAPYAAYANSTFSYSCELQHHGSWGSAHSGVIVVPAVQALGETLGSSGRDLIAAMVAGYEVQGRLGMALFKPAAQRHFHPQGVLGVFSASAAAGTLLGLDEEQQAHAFAIAGSHASTILEYDQAGGEVKRLHGAIALRGGMQSALLAKEGLTGPLSVFEGKHGIFASFGGGGIDPELPLREIGQPPCITRCSFRIYPTIGSTHVALDIVSDLMAEHSFTAREVESVRVGLPKFFLSHVTAVTRPHDVMSAQASLGFSLALRLAKGSNDLELYIDPASWRDPEIVALVDRVRPYLLTDETRPHLTRVEIRLKTGHVLEREQDAARGTATRPFSQDVLEDKFRRLASVLLPPNRVQAIMDKVARLEDMHSTAELVPALVRS
jgi:2-methylcitrate dehydratase PrpD